MGGGTAADTKTTTQQLTPEQQKLVGMSMPQWAQFANAPMTMPTGDQAVAGFTQPQVQGQSDILSATGAMGGDVGTAADTNRYLSSGAFLDPGSNPYVQNAVKAATNPIYQQLSTQTLPQLASGGAAGSGVNYGGSREGIAQGLASGLASQAAGNTGAGIMNTALGQGLEATGRAIGQAPTSAAARGLPGVTESAVGAEQQQQQQNVLNANNAAAMFQQMLPLLKAQALTSGAGALPGGSTTATGTSSSDPGLFADILGGASAAGGLLGGLGKAGGSAGIMGLAPLLGMI